MPLASLNPRIASFRPTGRKILVRRQPGETEVGGIVLPETRAKFGLIRSDVLAVSGLVPEVAPGDVVLMPAQMGYNRVDMADGPAEVVPMDSVWAVEAK